MTNSDTKDNNNGNEEWFILEDDAKKTGTPAFANGMMNISCCFPFLQQQRRGEKEDTVGHEEMTVDTDELSSNSSKHSDAPATAAGTVKERSCSPKRVSFQDFQEDIPKPVQDQKEDMKTNERSCCSARRQLVLKTLFVLVVCLSIFLSSSCCFVQQEETTTESTTTKRSFRELPKTLQRVVGSKVKGIAAETAESFPDVMRVLGQPPLVTYRQAKHRLVDAWKQGHELSPEDVLNKIPAL